MVRITSQMGEDPRRILMSWGDFFFRCDRLLDEVRLSLDDELAQKSMLLWARTRRFALTGLPIPLSTPGSRKDRLAAPPSLFQLFNQQTCERHLKKKKNLWEWNYQEIRGGDDRHDCSWDSFSFPGVGHICVRDDVECLTVVKLSPS